LYKTPNSFWTLAFAVTVTMLVCGSVALANAGIVADENNLTENFHPALWLMFASGLIGVLVSLPAMLAMKQIEKLQKSSP
jgi:hypothetical protein